MKVSIMIPTERANKIQPANRHGKKAACGTSTISLIKVMEKVKTPAAISRKFFSKSDRSLDSALYRLSLYFLISATVMKDGVVIFGNQLTLVNIEDLPEISEGVLTVFFTEIRL